MRRPSGLVLPAMLPGSLFTLLAALLGLSVLAGPALADDTSQPAADAGLVLAAEADLVLAAEADEPLGPNPQPRDAEENQARELGGYETQETPFTWGAAWLLAGAGFVGLLLLVGLYELRVRRPAKEAAGR